ncbi:hypothetical protein SO802_027078 [Lithocarpus litseifolius]|uniref:RNase H type-1 domain-containing protein n=1 Tax=Lithocarpus litseifolius TaxID=425828 RepID=A0AAW2C2D4_9ROSI
MHSGAGTWQCALLKEDRFSSKADNDMVRVVWLQLGVKELNQVFWGSNLQDWLGINGKAGSKMSNGGASWRVLFSFIVWLIWKSRNQIVISRKVQNPKLSSEIVNQTMEFMCCINFPRNPVQNRVKRIRWEKPPDGWMKLNTDGCAVGSPGQVGCGGVVRDSHGSWVSGFSRRIGITNSFVAKLWGLRDELILCNNLNIIFPVVELDT